MINLTCYTCRARCRPCSSVLTVLTGTAHCRSTVRLGIVIVVLPRRTILADRRCGSRVLAILALIAFSPRSAIRISVSSTAVCAGNLPSCRVLASYARCTRGSRAVGAVRSTCLSNRSSRCGVCAASRASACRLVFAHSTSHGHRAATTRCIVIVLARITVGTCDGQRRRIRTLRTLDALCSCIAVSIRISSDTVCADSLCCCCILADSALRACSGWIAVCIRIASSTITARC